ncbi:MAG: leucyl aminopeptidase [Candidatus Rokubacteria bacterium]|nr:leucyl aminopeptidase [Candidatus Rokubacteria bacterium]
MKVAVVTKKLEEVAADALVVGLHAEEKKLPEGLVRLDRAAGGQLKAALDAEKFKAKAGQVTHVHALGRRVVVAGLGPRAETTAEGVRRAAAAGVRRARDLGALTVACEVLGDRLPARQRAQAVVEGALLGTYAFERYKKEKADRVVEELRVVEPDGRRGRDVAEGVRRGEAFARAAAFARDLINAPANELKPADLARTASQLARDKRLSIRVYERAECMKLGMGAFLGVAAGSAEPPKFIHLTYSPTGRPGGAPAGRRRKRVALIGKGITFDSGGLDLKTAEGMLHMKYDMAGAAAVLGVLGAVADLKLPIEVHGLIAATENMPSGTATRPGDVLRAMNGTTIEVGNTDAEGRLTLADALCYVAARVKPDEVVDLATLTGACVVALGPLCAGLMANDDALAKRLIEAADAAGERLWRLPLIDEYREHLKSDIADLNNVGPRGGGAITAALFLKEFAGDMTWAHLDIAGPSFTEKDLPLAPKGATGAAVRTILTYLTS